MAVAHGWMNVVHWKNLQYNWLNSNSWEKLNKTNHLLQNENKKFFYMHKQILLEDCKRLRQNYKKILLVVKMV